MLIRRAGNQPSRWGAHGRAPGSAVPLLWRHPGSVADAVRVLQQEGVLWTPPRTVTPQAVNQRRRVLPPVLFCDVLETVLPQADARWRARTACRR